VEDTHEAEPETSFLLIAVMQADLTVPGQGLQWMDAHKLARLMP
jgi:hypothetical protein